MLPRFVNFLQARQEPHITAQSALEWAQQADVQPAEWARRVGFVRGFARYCGSTAFGASPWFGSSSSSSLGRDIRQRASASICCSPPDNKPAWCARRS